LGQRSETKATAREWPVSTYLVALALATFVPVTVCSAFLAYHFVSESSQLVRYEYEDKLRLMRNATELRVANIIEDLQVLALSPALQQGNFAAFKEHAIETARLIGATAIVVYDPDGQQVMNTRLGPDQSLPRRLEFDVERRVFETGLPQVSGLQRAVVDGQSIVTVVVPVRMSGNTRYAISIGLSTKYLSGLMDEYVSEGLVGSIIDGNGLLLARRPLLDGAELIAKPTIPEVLEHIGQSSAFWIKATSRTGVPTYSSILRSGQTGWTINLAIPREVIDGPLHRTVEWIVAAAALTFILSLVIGRLFAARFLTAFTGLEKYVTELGSNVAKPTKGPVAEVNRMQNVLYSVGQEIAGAEQVIERERSLLRATVESLPIGVLLAAPSGKVTLINERMLSIFGIDGLQTINDPERLSGLRANGQPYGPNDWPIARALREGIVTDAEEVVRVVHGARRNIMMTAVPVYDDRDEMIAAVCACYDVTDLRSALRQQKALLDEINHRVKNTLGTVQSMARLSRSSSQTLQEYAASFEGRLLALSEAYNLLTENNWEGASLKAIVERTLAPFAGPERLGVEGPPLLLAPKVALALSAAIQELSTNAAKYGALSAPSGKVKVSWSVQENGFVRLLWLESGGPLVSKPSRQGFGTKMIGAIFGGEPNWAVTADYEPGGLRCTMLFRADSSGPQGEAVFLAAAS
jgi:two-component sensor histidine kinase